METKVSYLVVDRAFKGGHHLNLGDHHLHRPRLFAHHSQIVLFELLKLLRRLVVPNDFAWCTILPQCSYSTVPGTAILLRKEGGFD